MHKITSPMHLTRQRCLKMSARRPRRQLKIVDIASNSPYISSRVSGVVVKAVCIREFLKQEKTEFRSCHLFEPIRVVCVTF